MRPVTALRASFWLLIEMIFRSGARCMQHVCAKTLCVDMFVHAVFNYEFRYRQRGNGTR